MPSTPLPKVNDPDVQRMAELDPCYLNAYNICLESEAELAMFANKLRHVRILGFLLLHAPNRGVRSEVAKCICSCEDSGNLSDLGAFFERNVIVPFKKYKNRTPNISEHPSRQHSFEDTERTKAALKEAPRDHDDAKKDALTRDGGRCVVTDFIDLGTLAVIHPTTIGVRTHCAHIIPESTFFDVEPKTEDNHKLDYSASTLAVLKQFHYDISKFNGEHVHSLTNVMTMEIDVYEAFDQLELYFEATPEENRYELKCFGGWRPNMRQFVTFSTPDPVNLPVPDPGLLALHAACCKVAYLSGASEYIDNVYHDADTMGILSADGASGDLLSYMLSSQLKNVSIY